MNSVPRADLRRKLPLNPMYPSNQQVAYPQVVVYPQYPIQKYVQPSLPTEVPIKETKKRKYDLAAKFPQGISLSWSVDAYVEKSVSVIEKLKNCCGKKSKESPVIYDSRLDPYQQRQPMPEPETTNVKQILRKVNGIVGPGQLCAIMGASGAGKTTLLNILNFRNRGNLIIDDDIKVNGRVVKSNEIPEYSGYVQQLDLFIGTLTVREQLILYAMLKMERHYTSNEKYARVDELINQLNLYKCQETRIGMGDLTKGISGGEKRRLAFAAEILNNPPLLFADEPTSGLDTFMAMTIVDILVDLKKQNKTLICTIHQPSSQIFEKFDTLCLLSEGRVAFFGPREEAYNFFSRLGYRCPSTYNPADFYIHLLAIRPNNREECLAKSKKICDAYDRSHFNNKINGAMAAIEAKSQELMEPDVKRPWFNATYFSQLRWLFWRETLNVLRNPIATYILAFQTIFIGVFLGLVFLRLKEDQYAVQNYTGVLFITLMQCNFGYVFAVINSLPLELPVLYREVKNRTYSVYIYFLSKQLAELPKFLILPFILITVIFWMSGISNDAGVYFSIVGILLLTTQVAVSFAIFLSIAMPSLDAALAISIPIIIPLLIFAGFFLNNTSVPSWLIWIKYISWFYYSNEALSIKFWEHKKDNLCGSSYNIVENNLTSCPRQGCTTGPEVLKNYLNIDSSHFSLDIGLLFVLLVVYRFGALFILKLKATAR